MRPHLTGNHWLKPLGYAGLLPFILLSLALWWPAPYLPADLLAQALLTYSALIFSFLSGLLWFGSFVLGQHSRQQASQMLWLSIVAMPWSWSWFLWNHFAPGLTFLAAGLSYVLLWAYERETLAHIYPQGFFVLRTHLTFAAALSLWLAGVAMLWGGV
ncbi:DUF3429 domain-containing protein [Thiomicrospira sp. WB1]|uniref:DUF3429 domain-containing protein n=1 Tax=Thiomicrospira sp. WB1 TaxID=1685380 RepID=UPI000748DEB2|nr:DUF3429 domain-containing protein [Thiomicrospira sp. WB1]KUJ71079.1 hypothetical protein AVO41_09415 [Thiomicrospira sp. WB1]